MQQERARLQNLWAQDEQFLCPANPNHKLISLDRLKYHTATCKELKTIGPTVTVYICQFYEGHMFMEKRERDDHEQQCRWKELPGANYDSNTNRHIVIKGGGKAIPKTQQSHYEYAVKKGLIKKKYEEPEISPLDFVFIRQPERIALELQKNIGAYLQTQNQSIALYDEREDDEYEFPKQSYFLDMLPLGKFLADCFQYGIPFNKYFRDNHKTISLVERNEFQYKLRNTEHRVQRIGFQMFIPLSVFDLVIKTLYPINTYSHYLTHLFEELKYKSYSDKIQDNLINAIKLTTQDHPKYLTQSCLINLEVEGEILFIVSPLESQFLRTFAYEYLKLMLIQQRKSDLVLMCFKINHQLALLLKPFLPEDHELEIEQSVVERFLWKTKQQEVIEIASKELKIEQVFKQDPEIQQFLEQQQILTERDKLTKQTTDNTANLFSNKSSLEAKRLANIQLSHQNQELRLKIQTVGSEQSQYDEFFKCEYRVLRKRIRETQELRYTDTQSQFETFEDSLLQDVRGRIKEAKVLTQQDKQLQSGICKLRVDIERVEAKINLLQEEFGRSEIEEVALKYQYNQDQELSFMVHPLILCKACCKNRVNVTYKSCQHSFLCQVCQEDFLKKGVRICLYCQKAITKIEHIKWETGYEINERDYVIIVKQ